MSLNDKNISVCGSDCAKCYCFGEMCAGCNTNLGRIFHAGGEECAIYACCVTGHSFGSCIECGDVPCERWKGTRDPKFTDEEFENNIAERIETLRNRKD